MAKSFLFLPLFVAASFAEVSFAQSNCENVKAAPVTVDGQSFMRYRVKSTEDLRCVPAQPVRKWTVKETSWTEAHEKKFQQFIYGIGKAIEEKRCNTVDTCLISKANPYRDDFDIQATHFADCADYPLYLRAYFAFKNNLPFAFGTGLKANGPNQRMVIDADTRIQNATTAYQNGVSQNVASDKLALLQRKLTEAEDAKKELFNPKDIFYSANGNHYASRYDVVNTSGSQRDFFTVTRNINNQFGSGSLRMLMTPPGLPMADFYAPRISRDSIIPGTVLYNAAGHVVMVYDVSPDGEVKIMDAKLDSSVGSDAYSTKFELSRVGHGAGFKNWRPIYIENPQYDSVGNIVKGKTIQVADREIPDFSLEQYLGNYDMNNSDTAKRKWVIKGKEYGWYDYLPEKLADQNSKYDPTDKIREKMARLCDQFQQRAASIENIIQDKINLKPHPKNLPPNVFSGDPEWHKYAIYRRDVNIRRQIFDVIDSAKKFMFKYYGKDPRLSYSGNNLKRDMIKAYVDSTASCKITYRNSSNQMVQLPFAIALKRVTSISPTPYFCPERMWGAKQKGELAACPDDTEKMEWYTLTQFFRNSRKLDTDQKMGWSIQDLRNKIDADMADTTDRSADYDILQKLNEL